MENEFRVIPYGNIRYAIEKDCIIVDDAQGYVLHFSKGLLI